MATNLRRPFGDKEPLIGKVHRGKKSEVHDYDRLRNQVRALSERMDGMQAAIDRLNAAVEEFRDFARTAKEDIDRAWAVVDERKADIADLQEALGSVKARLAALEQPKRGRPKNA